MAEILSPMKAMRAKCLDCCCGDKLEVRTCTIEQCPLHPYRMGHNPNRKGKGGKNIDGLLKYHENAREAKKHSVEEA